MPETTVLIASDHAGFELKSKLMSALPDINWIDLGPADASRVDYPDYADLVAKKISEAEGAQSGRLSHKCKKSIWRADLRLWPRYGYSCQSLSTCTRSTRME